MSNNICELFFFSILYLHVILHHENSVASINFLYFILKSMLQKKGVKSVFFFFSFFIFLPCHTSFTCKLRLSMFSFLRVGANFLSRLDFVFFNQPCTITPKPDILGLRLCLDMGFGPSSTIYIYIYICTILKSLLKKDFF